MADKQFDASLSERSISGLSDVPSYNSTNAGQVFKIKADGTGTEISDPYEFIEETLTGDDRGIAIKGGQLSVGTAENPQETVLGGGDSYPLHYGFHCDEANTTGNVITSAIDVTIPLQSDSGSVVGLFGGNTAGKYILVGSDSANFGGVKTKIVTTGLIEPQNIIGQYYEGGAWTNSTFMATDADIGLGAGQYGWQLCNAPNTSEQWRFGYDPNIRPTVWNKQTLNINGVDIEAFWARLLIASDITQDAEIEQIKLHTDRREINSNGFTEMFGDARPMQTLISGLRNTIPNGDADPLNETVEYSPAFSVKYSDNEFSQNANDGFTFQQQIDFGIDTSVPILVDISYYIKGVATGDVSFRLDVVPVRDQFVYDGNGAGIEYNIVDSVLIPSNLTRRTIRFTVPIYYTLLGDALVFNLHRNGAGDPLDTLGNNIVITNLVVSGAKYTA